MLGPSPSGQVSASSVHRQYSSRVSPFQAKTGMPFGSSGVPSGPTAIAAAAWSCAGATNPELTGRRCLVT